MTDEPRFIPQGWTTAPIGDLCDLINGRGFKRAEWKESGLPIIRIQNLKDPSAKFNYYQGSYDEKILISPGELLFAWSGTPGTSFGAFRWDGPTGVLNQHIFRVIFNQHYVDPKFFRYAMNERLISLIAAAQGGVGLRHVTKGTLAGTEVLLPPFNEQRRIADKLDAVLARVDACRERLDRVPAILKRFRQSVLAAATSGKLTEDWRAERGVEFAWKQKPLHALCGDGRIITYGVIKLGAEVPDGIPCLRTSNVRWLRIETEGMKRIDPALSRDYSRTILNGGEVLVNVRGTLGGVAVAEPGMAGWNVSREVAVVPVDEAEVDPWFLAYWVGSDSSQRWLGRVKKGVAYVGINIKDLRNLPVRIPTITEQQVIVERIQSLHRRAEALEQAVRSVQFRADDLTPALLAKAFRGELVPQDPNDETASILLQRIRAERAAATPKRPKSKGGRRSSASKKKEAAMLKRNEIGDEHLSAILKERGPLTAEALWSASQLEIDEFYDQLKVEEERGLLLEKSGDPPTAPRVLEAAA